MKYLAAVALAILLVVLPLAAVEASTIELNVITGAQNNEGHHFKVGIDAMATIPVTDGYSSTSSAMTGYFNSIPAGPWGGAGIYVTSTGVWAYVYVNTPGGTLRCPYPAVNAFNNQGCLLSIAELSLGNPHIVSIEMDYYPAPYNEWEFFASDESVGYSLIGIYPTTNDWFTIVTLISAFVYGTGYDPRYLWDVGWTEPATWTGGTGINWTPFDNGLVAVSTTSPLDSAICTGGIYGIVPTFNHRAWFAGSLQLGGLFSYTAQGVCSGYLFP